MFLQSLFGQSDAVETQQSDEEEPKQKCKKREFYRDEGRYAAVRKTTDSSDHVELMRRGV